MTEPLDLEPIKALIDEMREARHNIADHAAKKPGATAVGVMLAMEMSPTETALRDLIAEVERLRDELRDAEDRWDPLNEPFC